MSTFSTIANGTPMAASGFNQYANVFNGATDAGLQIVRSSASIPSTILVLPSGVASGSRWLTHQLSGDAYPRLALYINGSGNLGIGFGYGTSSAWVGQMEATSSGWQFLQNLAVNQNFTQTSGTLSTTNLSVSGATSITGDLTVNGGSGAITGQATQSIGFGQSGGAFWQAPNGQTVTITDDGAYIDFIASAVGGVGRDLDIMGDTSGGGDNDTISSRQNGMIHINGGIYLPAGTFSGANYFAQGIAGTSATISHGFPRAPSAAIASTGSTGTYSQWTDTSIDSYGSSTFTIHMGASGYQAYMIAFLN